MFMMVVKTSNPLLVEVLGTTRSGFPLTLTHVCFVKHQVVSNHYADYTAAITSFDSIDLSLTLSRGGGANTS